MRTGKKYREDSSAPTDSTFHSGCQTNEMSAVSHCLSSSSRILIKGRLFRLLLSQLPSNLISEGCRVSVSPAVSRQVKWRRERDSNPRYSFQSKHAFQACAFNRSATSPKLSKNEVVEGSDFLCICQAIFSTIFCSDYFCRLRNSLAKLR